MGENLDIFVVDDDDLIVQALYYILVSEGYNTRTFNSAESFLSGIDSDAHGCVFLDLVLPGMNGLEVLDALKRQALSGLCVVMMSGVGTIPLAVKAVELGAFDFIEKPFGKQTILGAVARARSKLETHKEEWATQHELRSRMSALTEREMEILQLLVSGFQNKEIAWRLGISQRTAETHRSRIMLKTRARNIVQLVQSVRDSGIDLSNVAPRAQ